MSTLETAFELQDVVNFALASQSIVPFGHPSVPTKCEPNVGPPGQGIWPYAGIFSSLIAKNGVDAHLVDIVMFQFYSQHIDPPNTWPDASVPYSLLDLRVLRSDAHGPASFASLLSQLAAILNAIPLNERHTLMQLASPALATRNTCATKPVPGPATGCVSLIDFHQLCVALLNKPLSTADRQVVTALRDSNLVVTCQEAVDPTVPCFTPPQKELVQHPPAHFGGVSFFYYPHAARKNAWKAIDSIVFAAVEADDTVFSNLRLCSPAGAGSDWFDLALENL
jgi:hypothetical protein